MVSVFGSRSSDLHAQIKRCRGSFNGPFLCLTMVSNVTKTSLKPVYYSIVDLYIHHIDKT